MAKAETVERELSVLKAVSLLAAACVLQHQDPGRPDEKLRGVGAACAECGQLKHSDEAPAVTSSSFSPFTLATRTHSWHRLARVPRTGSWHVPGDALIRNRAYGQRPPAKLRKVALMLGLTANCVSKSL